MRTIVSLIALATVVLARPASALTTDVNFFYFTDALAATTDTSSSRMSWDFAIMLNMNKKGNIVLGWNYSSVTASDDDGTTTTEYTSTEMGPRAGYYFGGDKAWSIFFTYNIIATADYSTGASTAEWRGTSMKGEFGYMPQVSDSFMAGLKLNYYKSTFGEQITNSTTLTSVSNGRTQIYPSLAFVYRFN